MEKPISRYSHVGHLRRRRFIPWLFVLPILLIHLIVIIGPSAGAVYFSLTNWNGIGGGTFIGLQNYAHILVDPDYWHAFLNNLLWLAFFLTVPVILGLIASSLIAPMKRIGLAFRTVLFIPYILPSVISASIWSNLLQPDVGLGGLLAKIGLPSLNQAYLGQTNTSLLSGAFVDNWHFWGFLMVLFLTAMQSVSPDLYDAADIDGVNRLQRFVHVTIPGIRPTLVFMLIMIGIWSFLSFDYVWILTQGGPAGSSNLLSILVFKHAFMQFDAGYASAIGLTMSFFAGLIIAIYLTLQKRGWEI